ncbi:MAG: hypothetical protein LQ350_008430, partial [Teloschistes chrysophthalmus]
KGHGVSRDAGSVLFISLYGGWVARAVLRAGGFLGSVGELQIMLSGGKRHGVSRDAECLL